MFGLAIAGPTFCLAAPDQLNRAARGTGIANGLRAANDEVAHRSLVREDGNAPSPLGTGHAERRLTVPLRLPLLACALFYFSSTHDGPLTASTTATTAA